MTTHERVYNRAHAPLKIIGVNKLYKSGKFRPNFLRFADASRRFDPDQRADSRLGTRPAGRAKGGAEYRFRAVMIHNRTFVVLRISKEE